MPDKTSTFKPGPVAHTFDPSVHEVEAGKSEAKVEAKLVYKVSSSAARATQRNLVVLIPRPPNKTKQPSNFK